MIPVLFQNENFLVVNKPSGMLSVPSRMGRKDSRSVVGLELEKQFKCQIFPVHRLDYEVSGLMLYAFTDKAHRLANRWFEKHLVQKTYLAATTKNENPEAYEFPVAEAYEFKAEEVYVWKSRLFRGKKRVFESPKGDPAETHAVLLNKKISLSIFGIDDSRLNELNLQFWKLQPITGRSHQLRYELAKRKFPILGDTLYGGNIIALQDTICLKAVELTLPDEALALGLPKKFSLLDF